MQEISFTNHIRIILFVTEGFVIEITRLDLLCTIVFPRTVKSGCILILPMAFDALLFVYPGEDADELGMVVVSVRGTCKFGSSGKKVLEGGGLKKPVEMRQFAQVPCHPARWVQRSTFLLPEAVYWLSLLATKSYPPPKPNRINPANKAEDEGFFYDFLVPYLKGRPCDITSHRKMIENNPYGHVRFGLHALVVHALGLPHVVSKRLMVFFQLCTLRNLTGYFQNPNGLASLPQPVLGCLFEFLPKPDAKRVVEASRLWGYQVLPSCFGHGKLHLERFAQSHPRQRKVTHVIASKWKGSMIACWRPCRVLPGSFAKLYPDKTWKTMATIALP